MQHSKWIGSAVIAFAALTMTGTAMAQSKSVAIYKIDANGLGESVGTLTLRDTAKGLQITPRLTGLTPGPHGFHVHQNPDCSAANGPNGQPAAGLAAGGHYDPKDTKAHNGPRNNAGHLGDLPVLVVGAKGVASQAVVAPRLKLADVAGRSIMIHAAGDNYSDTPAPLGGGGARAACGVIY